MTLDSLCACACRAVRREPDESQRGVARVYVYTQHRIWRSAVYSSSLVSCLFCVRGAAGRHGGGRHSPPSPKGVTPAAARTALFFTLPVRSCREGPERFGSILLGFFGFASFGRVTPFSRVTREPLQPAALSLLQTGEAFVGSCNPEPTYELLQPRDSYPPATRRGFECPSKTQDTLEPTTVMLPRPLL